jgi:hypothetical protein
MKEFIYDFSSRHNPVYGPGDDDYGKYFLPQVENIPPMPECKPPKDLKDEIAYPAHYNASSIQPIDVIEAWGMGYNLGNVIKYVCRHKHKGTPIKDLKKAQWYLAREISALEKESQSEK